MELAAQQPVEVGARCEREACFDAASIKAFATLCGDHNPLHHDEARARASTFGGLIASGPHVTSLMMGLDASWLTRDHDALGLGFEFRFLRAIPAGTVLKLAWTVTACRYKPSLDGFVVEVEGEATDVAGTVYTTGRGANLVRSRGSICPVGAGASSGPATSEMEGA
jgi:3-hydroxybutyryl-CoA dehydratase